MSDQTVVVRLRAEVAQYRAAMREATGSTREFTRESQQQLTQLGRQMEGIGRTATRRLTLPLVGAGAASIKLATDFDTSMTRIQALVGLSADEVDGMRDSVMALSGETARAPGELADALFFITSAGLEGSEALDALEWSAKAAAVGLGDTATIADLVTSAMNAYGSEVLSAQQATDALTMAVRLGKLEPDQLAGSMGRVLPIASALGVEFHEVGAAMAAMSRTGTDANEAATQLRGIFNTILSPSTQARQALADVGLTVDDLQRSLREDGLLATLELMLDAFDGNVTAMEQVFGNVRALSGVMDMLGSNVDGTRAIFDGMADAAGVTDEAFETMAETVGHRMRQAWVNFQRVLLEVGTYLAPLAATALEVGAALFSIFSWMPQWLQLGTLGFLGFVAAVGPLLWMGGTIVRNLAAIATGIRLVATAAVAAPGRIMSVVRALGPMGLSGVGVAAAVGIGLVAYQINRSRQRAQEARQRIQDYANAIRDAGDAAEGTANQINRMLDESPDVVRQWAELGVNVDELARKVHASDDEWTAYLARLRAVAEEAGYSGWRLEVLMSGIESVRNEAREAVELNDLRDRLDGVGDAAVRAREKVGPAADAMGTAARLAYEAAGGTGDLADGFDDVADGADNARHALAELNDAMRAMNDPIFAYDRAQRSLAEAQADLNEAIAEHGPNSQEAADATWDLYQAATDLSYAERELIRAFEEGEISAALFNAQLEEMVAQGRLTAEQAEEARRRVQGLTEAAKEADKQSIRIHVSAAVDAALASIQAVGSALAALPAVTSVMVQSTAVGKTLNRAPTRATGGPTSAYETYLVGEEGPELLTMGSTGGHIYPAQSTLTMAGTAPAAPTTAGFAGGMSGGLAGHGGGEVHHHYELHGEFNGFGPDDIPKIADEVSRYLAWQSRARARGER